MYCDEYSCRKNGKAWHCVCLTKSVCLWGVTYGRVEGHRPLSAPSPSSPSPAPKDRGGAAQQPEGLAHNAAEEAWVVAPAPVPRRARRATGVVLPAAVALAMASSMARAAVAVPAAGSAEQPQTSAQCWIMVAVAGSTMRMKGALHCPLASCKGLSGCTSTLEFAQDVRQLVQSRRDGN